MATVNVQFVRKSGNEKTGKIPVTTSGRNTCPKACPFNHGNGCYADAGYYTRMNWDKVTDGKRGGNWAELCASVEKLPDGQIWRHNVAGDLPHNNETISMFRLADLVKANSGKMGFTYTHHDMENPDNREAIRWANSKGFTINLSGNNPDHADKLADLNIGPVVTVCAPDVKENFTTKGGRKVIVCPATIRDNVSCETCKMCARQRDTIIAFPAHGGQASKIDV